MNLGEPKARSGRQAGGTGLGTGTEPVLVVDLDGTLLRSDLLMETALIFVREQPWRFLDPVNWLLQGKAALKRELADATNLDVAMLPYDETIVDFIRVERNRGRWIVLATASHRSLADRVAGELKLFDEVIATDGDGNLSAKAKRDVLVHAFGARGFDYVGNSSDDLPVWGAARHAYVANASSGVEAGARRLGNVARVFTSRHATLHDWARAIRVHQWLKNLLVLVPLFAAHLYTDGHRVLDALIAFLCFCLCSSSVYVLNDLFDLSDDRQHERKRSRPFAEGRLSIRSGLIVFPVLVVVALGLSLGLLPAKFALALGVYYGLSLAYSLSLKRHSVVDVMALAALYTLRVIAGAFAIGVALSFWLLAFSMFIFLSLALVKRYAELFQRRAEGRPQKAPGRGYHSADLEIIASLGAAAGYMSVMVLALYINDSHTAQLYRRPEVIWLACPLLLAWVSRLWMLAHRGQMHEDPVIYAVTDRWSLLSGALLAMIFWAAS